MHRIYEIYIGIFFGQRFSGTVKLVGTDYDMITNEVSALLDNPAHYDKMSKAVNPYGDGKACARIILNVLVRNDLRSSAVCGPEIMTLSNFSDIILFLTN